MADFVKAFRLMLDADTKGAVDGLTGFESAAKKAEATSATTGKGISGSFGNIIAKTGLGQKAMETFGVSAQTMGTVAVGAVGAAGVAVTKFALDGAKKFGELGLAVGKFSAVAGVPAETASKFIAVADDYGVGADTMSTAIGKLGKGLGTNAQMLEAYGVTVAKSKDGNIDLAGTLLNVVDAYNGMQDPAKKSKLATDAFGKGYQELIPLITQGSAKIKASFDDVSGAQILDAEDVKKAQDYRLAMDSLGDASRDLAMTLGKELIPTIKGLGAIADAVSGEGDSGLSKLLGYLSKLNVFASIGTLVDVAGGQKAQVVIEGTAVAIGHVNDNLSLVAEADKKGVNYTQAYTEANQTLVDVSGSLIQSYKDQVNAIGAFTDAMLGQNDVALASQQADLATKDALDEYTKSIKDGTLSAREHQQAFIDVQKAVNDDADAYVAYQKNLAESTGATYTNRDAIRDQITKLQESQAEIEVGSPLWNALEEHIRQLNAAAAAAAGYKNMATSLATAVSGYFAGTIKGPKAAGGPVSAFSTYRVNERGEEFFTPTSAGYITPAGKWGGGGSSVIINNTFNVPPNFDKVAFGRLVTEAQSAYLRTGGTRV